MCKVMLQLIAKSSNLPSIAVMLVVKIITVLFPCDYFVEMRLQGLEYTFIQRAPILETVNYATD